MRLKAVNLFFLLSCIIVTYDNLWAWDDKLTHRDISGIAAEKSVLNIQTGNYLQNLGYNNGIDEVFSLNGIPKKIRKWIEDGGEEEDADIRYLNHFHNPLKEWDQAGLSTNYPNVNGKSSVLWAQYAYNDWSWQATRGYYYYALTSFTETQRSGYFAKTFKGLGYIAHLIQDASQPAHVRNDPHPLEALGLVDGFESWAVENRNQIRYYMNSATFPAVSLNTSVAGYAPITQFIDTNQYTGSNPSNSASIGLSEYTNANFISEDTKFNSFIYPRWADMQYYEEPAGIWGNFYKYRKYYRKTGGGEQIEHFVNAGRLTKYLDSWTVEQVTTLGLDDQCYKDYADKLIPRAVGYSAGLLNYFFRGKMNMEKDPLNAGKYIIKNESSEKMEGTFTIYYDDALGNRNAVSGASWTLTINPNSTSSSVTFTEPTSPAPKEKGKYILVFSGKLGMEEGAVVGFVYNPKWAFLVIKQASIESDVVEWECTGCESEWGYFIDLAYKWNGSGYWNSWVLKFDLEWLGEVNTITNVALIDFYNSSSCDYETTGDLYNQNGHSIYLIRPTAGSPRGYIEVHLTGNREIRWPFPSFIRVDTIDMEGNPQSFYEPIFKAYNMLYSVSEWDVGQYTDYYKSRHLLVSAEIPTAFLGMCASGKVNASYTFDLNNMESSSFRKEEFNPCHTFAWTEWPSSNRYYYSGGEMYCKSYEQEPLLPFFPYTVEQLKIKRTWKQSTLDFLESVGYDITELPTWDIYIDHWKTDYKP